MKSQWIFLLFILLFLCSCGTNIVTIHTATTDIPVNVEIADSTEEHAVGLMFRTELANNSGMLFVFDDEQQRGFWMKNTKIPLDILFIDNTRTIVDIKENFQPCTATPCEIYISQPAQYALEVNAGFVQEHDIFMGDAVTFK